MKKLGSLFLLLIVLAVSGCAGFARIGFGDAHIIPTAPEPTQTAPESTQTASESTQTAPESTHAIPIPLKVGVLLDDSLVSSYHGLVVIKEWENMQLFDSLVYPYQENDLVDIVMRLSITSGGEEVIGDTEWVGWRIESWGPHPNPYYLRILRAVQGATFTHDALTVINQSSDEIGQYSVQVATTIQLGKNPLKDTHGRNYVKGYDAGYELQGKRLAFELAKKIRADRQNLLSKLGKSQEEIMTP